MAMSLIIKHMRSGVLNTEIHIGKGYKGCGYAAKVGVIGKHSEAHIELDRIEVKALMTGLQSILEGDD